MTLASPALQRTGVAQGAHVDLKTKINSHSERILVAVTAGQTNAEIGRTLHLSEATIKAQLTGIMKRLNVSNRVQLAVLGVRSGLMDHAESHAHLRH